MQKKSPQTPQTVSIGKRYRRSGCQKSYQYKERRGDSRKPHKKTYKYPEKKSWTTERKDEVGYFNTCGVLARGKVWQ